MTTFLYSIPILTAGGDRMAQVDPHGWTLTLISVSVVFIALVILYFLYSLSGSIFSGKFSRKSGSGKGGERMDEVAAAIALALSDAGNDGETAAAIAVALDLYLDGGVHDQEPGFITIRSEEGSAWGQKQFNFRKNPKQ